MGEEGLRNWSEIQRTSEMLRCFAGKRGGGGGRFRRYSVQLALFRVLGKKEPKKSQDQKTSDSTSLLAGGGKEQNKKKTSGAWSIF